MNAPLAGSTTALWNRSVPCLESDEVLGQILDRGDLAAWRELYVAAATDPALRARIRRVVHEVPTPLPRFWLAALASLGETVDFEADVPDYFATTSV